MRILFVTPYYYPELKFGGPPKKMHAVSCGLVQRGHHVKVATFHSERRRARQVEMMDGVEVRYLPWMGWGRRQCPLDFRSLADAVRQSDIVHGYGLYDLIGPVAAHFARRQARPYVLEPLGMYVPRARNIMAKKIYHWFFTNRMAKRAARVVAASPAEKNDLLALVEERRIVVRRNGIDIAAFENLPSGDAARKRLGILPEEKIILYLGRISPIKNLEQLVGAFAKAELKSTRLVLAGPESEPDYAAKLRQTISSLRLNGKVIFAGPLFDADKLAALAATEVFVLPSLSESFGNAAAEAVAAGVPVLLSDTCGIAPMIHQRAGLAVPLGEDSLARGLRVLMTDAGQLSALTERRGEVVKELSWEEPLNQMERIYQTILARK